MTPTGLTITGYIRNVLPSGHSKYKEFISIECLVSESNNQRVYDGYLIGLPDEIEATELKKQVGNLVTVNVTARFDEDIKRISFHYAGKFICHEYSSN